jgi:hypothetical protein
VPRAYESLNPALVVCIYISDSQQGCRQIPKLMHFINALLLTQIVIFSPIGCRKPKRLKTSVLQRTRFDAKKIEIKKLEISEILQAKSYEKS